MKRTLLVAFAAIVPFLNGMAQQPSSGISDLSRFELHGAVKKVTINYFRSQKINATDNETNNPVFSEIVTFNENGHLISYENRIDTTYTITADHAKRCEYEEGKLRKVSASGYRYEIEHDTLMNITNVYEYKGDSLFSVFRLTYNQLSQLAEEMQYDNQRRLQWIKRWLYDTKGNMMTYIEEKWNELLPILVRTDYDNLGNIVRKYDAETKISTYFIPIKDKMLYYLNDTNFIDKTLDDKNKQVRIAMEQELDKEGNWIQRVFKNFDRNMKMTTRRIIDYHSQQHLNVH